MSLIFYSISIRMRYVRMNTIEKISRLTFWQNLMIHIHILISNCCIECQSYDLPNDHNLDQGSHSQMSLNWKTHIKHSLFDNSLWTTINNTWIVWIYFRYIRWVRLLRCIYILYRRCYRYYWWCCIALRLYVRYQRFRNSYCICCSWN